MENDSFEFSIADMADWDDDGLADPLHTVTAYEQENSDVHALHDFFETVISPNGTYLGIAYQQNIALHPFEAEEEQRYIKVVSGSIDPAFSASSSDLSCLRPSAVSCVTDVCRGVGTAFDDLLCERRSLA